jgi:hypothetical protein
MRKATAFSAVAVLLIIVIAAMFATNNVSTVKAQESQPFHVGVTFGGDNSADAKLLIDKIKDYTNLFVIASGPLQSNIDEMVKTCDYAVNSGLDIIVYFGSYETNRGTVVSFIDTAQKRWGSHFLGIYYGDEPSGKTLDGIIRFDNVPNLGNVTAGQYGVTISQTCGSNMTSKSFYYNADFLGQINVQYVDTAAENYTTINYFPNGTIAVAKNNDYLIYLTNGTVLKQTSLPNANNESWALNGTVLYREGSLPQPSFTAVTDRGDISQFGSYQQLWDSRPFQTMDELSAIATSYVKTQQTTTGWIANQDDVKLFTSDYVLYWWDYQIGYDTVFAELGWNNTIAQEIGLVRGAANLQNKSWGTIVDWKYNQPPYLPSGDEMFDQMRLSYECGAQYVLVFNYAENMTDPYGTLQEEHLQALQRFWNDVVQNTSVVRGGIKAEAALVLPEDYGWGMRNANDSIWGLWKTEGSSRQIWNQLQNKLEQHGSKLDIVYEDSAYPVSGQYSEIYYWNQSVTPATPLVIGVSIAAIIAVGVTIIVFKRKLKSKRMSVFDAVLPKKSKHHQR